MSESKINNNNNKYIYIFKSNLCKKDKNVIYLGLLAQIEGARLNNVFFYQGQKIAL